MAKLQTVINQLIAEEYLAEDSKAGLASMLSTAETETAWYIQAAIGISAWIASLFIIGFLVSGIAFLESGFSFIVVGLVFCAGAVGVKRRFPRSIFGGQLSLAFSLTGQILAIVGIGMETESILATSLTAIVLELVLIALYPSALHRFLSSLIIIGAVLAILEGEWELYESIHIVILLLAGASLVCWFGDSLWVVKGLEQISRPVGYAVVIALFGLLLPSVIIDLSGIRLWWVSTLGLMIITALTVYLIVEYSHFRLSPAIWAIIGGEVIALTLLSWQAPGILGAFAILLLGFGRGNRLLMGLASAFLVFFIGAFYYNLDITLLQKSFILIGTGALLIVIRFALLALLKPAQEVA